MAFFTLNNKDDYARFMRETWAWEENAPAAIQRYPEFSFSANGKFSAMVLGGEDIGHLMNANGCPDFRKQHDCSQLRSIAGAIVVYDEHDEDSGELLVYRDGQELIDAWRELHGISGVAMSEADAERLAEYDEDEDDE